MTDVYSASPAPAYGLIPSEFPPIGLFDTVATAADLASVMDLVGWTNDRIVAERLARLPQAEWVFGRQNASVVMAAFLHVAPGGMRFNSNDFGAWYAAAALTTAAVEVEVAHHLRREAVARGAPTLTRKFRTFTARSLLATISTFTVSGPPGLQSTHPIAMPPPRFWAKAFVMRAGQG